MLVCRALLGLTLPESTCSALDRATTNVRPQPRTNVRSGAHYCAHVPGLSHIVFCAESYRPGRFAFAERVWSSVNAAHDDNIRDCRDSADKRTCRGPFCASTASTRSVQLRLALGGDRGPGVAAAGDEKKTPQVSPLLISQTIATRLSERCVKPSSLEIESGQVDLDHHHRPKTAQQEPGDCES